MPVKGAALPFAKKQCTQNHTNTLIIRFFAVPDGTYEVYCEEAEELCRALYRPSSSLDTVDGDSLLTVSSHSLNSALRECLFVQNWIVHIYGSINGSSQWTLQRTASPGNYDALEDLLVDTNTLGEVETVVAGIVIADNLVGMAAVSGHTVKLAQFEDDGVLLNMETAIVQLGIREIVFPESAANRDYSRLRSIATALNIVCTGVKSNLFSAENGEMDIFKLSRSQAECHQILGRHSLSIRCLTALVSYLSLLSNDAHFHSYSIHEHQLSQYVRIDETGLRSLDLFPSNASTKFGGQQRGAKKRVDSLFSLLNKCRTNQGSQMLAQWIRQPLRDQPTIERRLDVIEELIKDPNYLKSIGDSLNGCSDLSRIGKKIFRGRARLQDLMIYHQVMEKGAGILALLQHNQALFDIFGRSLEQCLLELKPCKHMIDSSVDMAALARHEYCLLPAFDPALQDIANKKEQCLNTMGEEHQRVSVITGLERFKKLKMERSGIYGYHFRVSRLDSGSVKGKEFMELAVQKSGLFFATGKLKKLSEEYVELEDAFGAAQSVFIRQMVTTCASFRDHFDVLNSLIAIIDVLSQLAVTAIKPYCRPKFTVDYLCIVKGRHAILEELCAGRREFVENGVTLDSSQRFKLITGPNMGGKSTFMRQTAIISLLAQMGSFVPAESAALPLTDAIMVRVGAGDNLSRGISTFQAEMLEMSSILKVATSSSLVLIDEMGRGTSSSEGLALAYAISKHLVASINPFCLFATHFHELPARLSRDVPSQIGNLRMRAYVDAESRELKLEYVVEDGFSDRSFGIECAKLAGLPVRIRRRATGYLAILNGLSVDREFICRSAKLLEGVPVEHRSAALIKLVTDEAPENMKQSLLNIINA